MYVTLAVETPKNLNAKQKEILRQFEAETTGRSYEKNRSFWDKVKDIFN